MWLVGWLVGWRAVFCPVVLLCTVWTWYNTCQLFKQILFISTLLFVVFDCCHFLPLVCYLNRDSVVWISHDVCCFDQSHLLFEYNNNNNNNNNNRIQRRYSRFLTISSQCRELSPTRTLKWPGRNHVQITCNTSNAYHMQVSCTHLVRRDSSAIKFDRIEIAFIWALFYWLNH